MLWILGLGFCFAVRLVAVNMSGGRGPGGTMAVEGSRIEGLRQVYGWIWGSLCESRSRIPVLAG